MCLIVNFNFWLSPTVILVLPVTLTLVTTISFPSSVTVIVQVDEYLPSFVLTVIVTVPGFNALIRE